MSRLPSPVFLKRSIYRRRLMDAARLLPIVGLLLFLMPLMWASGTDTSTSTVCGVIYLFVIWAGLILIAAWMARYLSRPDTDQRSNKQPE